MHRVLGHRILIKPDEQPEASDSGILLPQDRHHVPCSGTVVAVGDGPKSWQKVRAGCIKRCLSIIRQVSIERTMRAADTHIIEGALRAYLDLSESMASSVAVGDRVVYPVEAGLAMSEDGVNYIIVNEDDVAIIASEEVAA